MIPIALARAEAQINPIAVINRGPIFLSAPKANQAIAGPITAHANE